MKKNIVILLVLLCLAGGATAFGSQSSIDIIVDGKLLVTDAPARLIDGRVLVPVRAVSEALGFDVAWDPVNYRVIITSKKQPSEDPDLSNKKVIPVNKTGAFGDTDILVDSIEVYPLANKTNVYLTLQNNSGFKKVHLLRKSIKFQQGNWVCNYIGNTSPIEISPGETLRITLRFEEFNTTRDTGLLKFELEDLTGIRKVEMNFSLVSNQ